MPASSRWPLPAICFVAFGLVGVSSPRPAQIARAADPPRDSSRVTVYDPDPTHLWNRLHEALYVRLDGEGPDDPGGLDPFLWQDSPYREKGERSKRAAAML